MTGALPFDLPFTEASKFFARKVTLTREEFEELAAWAKQRAFTVTTTATADVLQDIFNATQQAIDEGLSQADFNAAFDDVMSARGWAGTTPWHGENVLRTNVQSAYGSGGLAQARAQADDFPYWLFVAVIDDRTTPECEELNGTVFPISDTKWWPPIDYECRSGTESLTQQEAEELGIDPDPELPDPTGFDGPGSANGDEYTPDLSNLDDALAAVVQDVLDGYDPGSIDD